jgi:hypothetical protein
MDVPCGEDSRLQTDDAIARFVALSRALGQRGIGPFLDTNYSLHYYTYAHLIPNFNSDQHSPYLS